MIHVYTVKGQPATHFIDRLMPGRVMHFRYSPRKIFRCESCGRLRLAKNLTAQVYYDGTRFFCTERERYRGNIRCKLKG